jgi:hypothetical protein
MSTAADFPVLRQHLHAAMLAPAEPPGDLWARIADAHAQRLARRTRLRYAGRSAMAAMLTCALIYAALYVRPNAQRNETVDWQARAQALELQLGTLDHSPTALAATDVGDVESELAQVDRLLQTAYERSSNGGEYTNELVPLWKRRSELLNTLIVARKQGLALTRI